jgi:hypothetical protein
VAPASRSSQSGSKEPIDPRKRGLQTCVVIATATTTQGGLPATQPRPQILAIYKDTPIGHYLGQEGGIGLGVFELHDINRTTGATGELRAEIDYSLKAGIAHVDEHVDVAVRRVGTRRGGAEQQREANIVLSPQRRKQCRKQPP